MISSSFLPHDRFAVVKAKLRLTHNPRTSKLKSKTVKSLPLKVTEIELSKNIQNKK